MNQEEKSLLLQDLCARLPHGIVVHYNGLARPLFGIEPTQHFQITLDNALDGEHNGLVYVSLDVDGEEPKPYLRPMSSMTEEEKRYIHNKFGATEHGSIETYCFESFEGGHSEVHMVDMAGFIDWLNKHHFDYRGLIPMGLAIEVTEDNNPYKE